MNPSLSNILKVQLEARNREYSKGRKLIVNAIKGLGKVLKALVKTVFAKFPAIANRICNKIDSVVNRAVKLVNQTAPDLSSALIRSPVSPSNKSNG